MRRIGVPAFTAEHTKGVCQITFEISDEMINADGRMGIGSLARQMQKITEIHFDQEAGLTGEELLAKGLSWVISWTDIELVRMPNKGEKVILRIWPGKNKVNLYSRVYAMYTEAGEPLMATSSLFLLMDQVTRRVAVQPEEMKIINPVIISGEPNLPKLQQKFPKVYRNQLLRTVSTEEIDYNCHLNNSRYLDWTEALLDEEFYAEHTPKKIWVQYAKELQEGEKAKIQYVWEEDVMYLRGVHNGEESFLVKMMF